MVFDLILKVLIPVYIKKLGYITAFGTNNWCWMEGDCKALKDKIEFGQKCHVNNNNAQLP